MKRQKSAKEKAFENERVRYRRTIRSLEDEIKTKDSTIKEQKDRILELEEELRIKDEWNERLLEFMDLPEEELERLIAERKAKSEITECLHGVESIFSQLFGHLI